MLPELTNINTNKQFSAHNYLNKKMKIRNLNSDKISNLNTSQIEQINSIFRKEKDILDFFNYSLIE